MSKEYIDTKMDEIGDCINTYSPENFTRVRTALSEAIKKGQEIEREKCKKVLSFLLEENGFNYTEAELDEALTSKEDMTDENISQGEGNDIMMEEDSNK